jgi:lipopolysaccharide export system permease protein
VAARGKLRGGLPVTVSLGICIAFLYFFVVSICLSFGYGGILPPVVAAWAAHVIFLSAGGVALITSA